MKILAIIPARGGSKGIPRKNVRPLNGKPLIYYSIKTALNSKYITDVYVSSEDDEILTLAKKFGSKIHKRDISLSEDSTTLDPVVYRAYKYIKEKENNTYDIVVTLQPTSPLLKTNSIDTAIEKMIKNKNIDTIISVKNDTHLSWKLVNGKYIPNFEKRVNRQYLTPIFRETGGFLISRSDIISDNNRIGSNVDLYELGSPESIDIDTYEDWNLCEYYLKRKKILFVVTGNEKVGLGHVYNTLLIANDILDHEIYFLVDKESKLAFDKIFSNNYNVFMQKSDDLIEDIKKINPDIIINDILDTKEEYIKSLKKLNYKVINFEDLGKGARLADLVINAIYPEKEKLPNHYFGPNYFLLRDEFIYSSFKDIKREVKKVLITFGGVDPNNYTKKVLDSIYDYCMKKNILIEIITGFGYKEYSSLKEYENVQIFNNVSNISDHMLSADIIFTSAGRTIYEIASLGVPSIVLAQNERELTHFFASKEYGFLNLGLGIKVSKKEILKEFDSLVNNYEMRKNMNFLMRSTDLRNGRKRVLRLIKNLIEV